MLKTLSNIDTICLLIYIENYEVSACNLISYLQDERDLLISSLKDSSNKNYILNINGLNFELLANGCKGYAFILRNDGFEIKIAKYSSKIENFAPVQIRISSEYLWSYGIQRSWQIISDWISVSIGTITQNKVCRLDLCTHVSGVDFITNFENCYKGHFKKFDKIFHTGKSINAITFGSRKGKNIYCRIYNKTLEVLETNKKLWFYEIWTANGLDCKNVWNLEFELKSEFLRSVGIITIQECLVNISKLWNYCTCEWLVKIDRTTNRVDRCPINEQWLEIQNAFGKIQNNSLIQRENQISIEANRLFPSIIGNITSYFARLNKNNMEEAFRKLYSTSKRYLSDKNTSFEQEVSRKKKLLYQEKEEINE